MQLLIALFLILLPQLTFCQGLRFSSDHKQDKEPAFEKIYVKSSDLVTLPDGTYYYDETGKPIKIRALLHDVDGMYIILVTHQCPLCGKCYSKEMDEEYDCPIYKLRISPRVWTD